MYVCVSEYRGEPTNLYTHVVFVSKFRFHGAKSAKLPTQFESGQ